MLSINVAELDVIRIGLEMIGYRKWERLVSTNKLVGRGFEEFNKFRL